MATPKPARRKSAPEHSNQAFERLAEALPDNVILERYRREFPKMLRRCRLSVSQAGYNTILDILTAGARAVVVPFASERETEQQLRAERLTACGVLELLPETQLTAAELAHAIERAIKRDRRMISVEMGGARRSAHLIGNMIRDPESIPGQINRDFVSQFAGGIIDG